MRLTHEQISLVLSLTHSLAGKNTSISLYGSRLKDDRRGGDLDLLIETSRKLNLLEKARLKMALESALSLPVDILFHQPGDPASPFYLIAKKQAVFLEHAA